MCSTDLSQLSCTCYSVVYQSNANKAILRWGCGSRWPVLEAFAGLKQIAISVKK